MIRVATPLHAAWICVCMLGNAAGCAQQRGQETRASQSDDEAPDASPAPAGDDAASPDGGVAGAAGEPRAAPAGRGGGSAAADGGSVAGDGGGAAPVAADDGGDMPAAAGSGGATGAAGATNAVAGSVAPPVAGAAAPLGPPGSNTAWLGGGQPVPCASDEHCVKTLYTPVCDLASAVCAVCPDRDQEIALAARVNACILFNSPRCLQDEECRFRDCVTTCEEGR